MKLCIHIDPAALRSWHLDLFARLSAVPNYELALSWAHVPATMDTSQRQMLQTYMNLEKRLYPNAAVEGASPIAMSDVELPQLGHDQPDMVLDLASDDSCPESPMHIVPLFDGHPGEKAAMAAILSAPGLPQIALRNVATDQLVATALPSAELAAGLAGGLDQLYARLITILEAFLRHPRRQCAPLQQKNHHLPGTVSLAKKLAKSTARQAAMMLYRRLFHASHWRVGWRWVDQEDVWSRQDLQGESWQVLDDPGHNFYADPFPLVWKEKHYLFFEDLNQYEQKGILSVVEFDDKGPTGPAQPCLEEDFHLSYPFFIEEEGELYMIPETSNNREVALYQAQNFPFGWQKKHVLLSDIDAADVTITQWQGKYWLFCVTRDGAGGYSDCLSLFHADSLFGPWQAHVQNPVLIDRATARPAGNMVQRDGQLWRPVQDCTQSYGAELALCQVTRLDEEGFEQVVHRKLTPNEAWPGRKLHSLNRAGRLEVVDGAILRPKWQFLRPWFDKKFAPATNG